jgi:hypothetical protein
MRFVLELALVGLYMVRVPSRRQDRAILRLALRARPPAHALDHVGDVVAPRASDRLRDPARLALELALFAAGGAMLVATNRAIWAVVLIAAFVLDRVLLARVGMPSWAIPAGDRVR